MCCTPTVRLLIVLTLPPRYRKKLAGVVAKARSEGLSKDDNFPHLVGEDDMRIVDKPPTIFHLNPKADVKHRLSFQRVLAAYRKNLAPERLRLLDRFSMKDLVFKAVGVGSVGTFCCVGLFLTADNELFFAAQASAALRAGAARRQAKI